MKEKLDINLAKPKKYSFNILDFLIIFIVAAIIFTILWQNGVFESKAVEATATIAVKIENIDSDRDIPSNGMTVYNRNDNSPLGNVKNLSVSDSKVYLLSGENTVEIATNPYQHDITFEISDVSGKYNGENYFFFLPDGNYITVGDEVEIISEAGVFTAKIISFKLTRIGDRTGDNLK